MDNFCTTTPSSWGEGVSLIPSQNFFCSSSDMHLNIFGGQEPKRRESWTPLVLHFEHTKMACLVDTRWDFHKSHPWPQRRQVGFSSSFTGIISKVPPGALAFMVFESTQQDSHNL